MPRIRVGIVHPLHPRVPRIKKVPKNKIQHVRANLYEGKPIKHAHVQRGDMISQMGSKTHAAVLSNRMGVITGEKRNQYAKTTVRYLKSDHKPLQFHGTTSIQKTTKGGPGAMGPRNSKKYSSQLKKRRYK